MRGERFASGHARSSVATVGSSAPSPNPRSMGRVLPRVFGVAAGVLLAGFSHGQIVVEGANGSDGALDVVGSHRTINLAEAPTGAWDSTSPIAGKGVYDPEKWAVVFHYTNVRIANFQVVNFTNHPSHAPVVWLVSGNVTIDTSGVLSLDGANGGVTGEAYAEPGPGGFRGGGRCIARLGSAGFGPGGGRAFETLCARADGHWAGSHATAGGGGVTGTNLGSYGNARLLLLVGGSGGSHSANCCNEYGGGGGGGAILIACQGTITINSTIRANGGGGTVRGGAGGSIRLIANQIAGAGTIQAIGNNFGGDGRIQMETNLGSTALSIAPAPAPTLLPSPVLLWPAANSPSARIVSISGDPAPLDPRASLTPPFTTADMYIRTSGTRISLETSNVSIATPPRLRVIPTSGVDVLVTPTMTPGGTFASATWTASFPLNPEFSIIQATTGNGAASSREISLYRKPCVADLDDGSGTGTPDAGITIDDLLYYLTLFENGATPADFDDGSGLGIPDGGVTIDDLLYFLFRFDAGC